MSTAVAGEKRRWLIATFSAAAMTAAVLWLFRVPLPPAPMPAPVSSARPVAAPAPAVQLAKTTDADVVFNELMMLRDMRPLFLPTDLNATLPEPKLELGRSFIEADAQKAPLPESDFNVTKEMPAVVTLNGKKLPDNVRPKDALALTPDAAGVSTEGFGRQAITIPPLEARGGFVSITSTATGEEVLAHVLGVDVRPAGAKPWSPLEFLATIDAAGLAAPLVLMESSQLEEVDAHFRSFLVRNLRIGERLRPGFYRIVVAP